MEEEMLTRRQLREYKEDLHRYENNPNILIVLVRNIVAQEIDQVCPSGKPGWWKFYNQFEQNLLKNNIKIF